MNYERMMQNNQPAPKNTKKSKKSKKGTFWRVIFIIASIVLVVALAALGFITFSYFQGQQKYDQLTEYVNVEDANSVDERYVTLESLTVDWDALKAINPDTVAWVIVPNTKINYPVVQGNDNSYYISHDFDGAEGALTQFGAVFMDARNNPDWQDEGYFIYGHHMNDGSMFAAVAEMANQEIFDSARTIFLLTPEGNFKLRSFSLLNWSADDSLVKTTFESEHDLEDYVATQIRGSIVNPGKIPAAQDIKKFFAFVTCNSFSGGRYVLYAYIEETTFPDSKLYKLYD